MQKIIGDKMGDDERQNGERDYAIMLYDL